VFSHGDTGIRRLDGNFGFRHQIWKIARLESDERFLVGEAHFTVAAASCRLFPKQRQNAAASLFRCQTRLRHGPRLCILLYTMSGPFWRKKFQIGSEVLVAQGDKFFFAPSKKLLFWWGKKKISLVSQYCSIKASRPCGEISE
jgi:hypothetical protein